MFLERTTETEFFSALENNINKNYSFDKDLQDKRASNIQLYLKNAAAALMRVGLRKEAECVIMISEQVKDPAVQNLTPENMVENLKEKGWVFNVDDQDADCSDCAEQPQLSQKELKALRAMLK